MPRITQLLTVLIMHGTVCWLGCLTAAMGQTPPAAPQVSLDEMQAPLDEVGVEQLRQQATAATTSTEKRRLLLDYATAASHLANQLSGEAALTQRTAAEAALQEIIDGAPDAAELPPARLLFARLAHQRGDYQAAILRYWDALTKHRQTATAPEAMFGLGLARQEAGKPDVAAETFRAFLAQYANHALATEAQLRYGETMAELGHYAEAEQLLRTAAEKADFPLADRSTLAQAAALAELGRHAEAAARLADFAERFPQSTRISAAQLASGRYALAANQTGTAIEQLTPLVTEDAPDAAAQAEARHWLARALLKENRPAEALTILNQQQELTTESPWRLPLILDEADARYALGEFPRAAELYHEVAQVEPAGEESPRARYMAALSALQAGNYELAAQAATAFAARHEQHGLLPSARAIQAEALLQRGEHQAAAEGFATVIADHPRHADARNWRLRQAWAHHLAGNQAEALSQVQTLIAELGPGGARTEALYLQGLAELAADQLTAGSETLLALVEAEPKWPQADAALLRLGTALAQGNQPTEAIETLLRIPTEYPHSPLASEAGLLAAETALAADEPEQARDLYTQWLKRAPADSADRPHVLYQRAALDLQAQDPTAAIEALTRLIEQHAEDDLLPAALASRSTAYFQQGQYAEAVADAERYLTSDSPLATSTADMLFIAGLSHGELGNTAEVIRALEQMIAAAPEHPRAVDAHFELAWAYLSAEQPDKAAGWFAALLEAAPESPYAAESAYRLGEFHAAGQRPREAMAAYRQAATTGSPTPLTALAWNRLGQLALEAKEYATAVEAFGQQLEIASEDVTLTTEGQLGLATSLVAVGEPREALPHFTAGLDHTSAQGQPAVLLSAARAAMAAEQGEQARAWLETLREKHPGSPAASDGLLLMGELLQSEGKTAEAVLHYHRVATDAEGRLSAAAQLAAARLLFELQDYQAAARDALSVAYAFSYEDLQQEALWIAAEALQAQQQYPRARQSYARLIEKFPHSEQATLAQQRLDSLPQ